MRKKNRIRIKSYKIGDKNDKSLMIVNDSEILCEYAKFTEFKTETKEYKILN